MLLPLLVAGAALAADPPLPVVEDLELGRLVGQWYEIGSIPTFFTRGCIDPYSRYTQVAPERFEVVTTCHAAGDPSETSDSDAELRVAQGGVPAKLEISYVPFVWGDFWVLERGPDYGYLVVGHPNRDYLWIYGRRQRLEPALLGGVLQRIAGLGFAPGEIRWRGGQELPGGL